MHYAFLGNFNFILLRQIICATTLKTEVDYKKEMKGQANGKQQRGNQQASASHTRALLNQKNTE